MIVSFNNTTIHYLASLLKLFSNYQLRKTDNSLYQVPLYFASASRLYKRLNKTTEGVTIRVPAMSLDFSNYEPDLARQTNRLLRRKVTSLNADDFRINFNDVSYNFNFTMTLFADTLDSLTNITENILSQFNNQLRYYDYKTPLGDIISTPIRLLSASNETDNLEDDYTDDRTLKMNFEFMIEGVIQHPITTDSKKLKQIQVKLYDEIIRTDKLIQEFNIDIDQT